MTPSSMRVQSIRPGYSPTFNDAIPETCTPLACTLVRLDPLASKNQKISGVLWYVVTSDARNDVIYTRWICFSSAYIYFSSSASSRRVNGSREHLGEIFWFSLVIGQLQSLPNNLADTQLKVFRPRRGTPHFIALPLSYAPQLTSRAAQK